MRYARVFTRFFRGLKCHVGAGRKLPAQSPLFTRPVPPLHLPNPPTSPVQFYRSSWQLRQEFFPTLVNHPYRPPV